jgi:hypothetical protein
MSTAFITLHVSDKAANNIPVGSRHSFTTDEGLTPGIVRRPERWQVDDILRVGVREHASRHLLQHRQKKYLSEHPTLL